MEKFCYYYTGQGTCSLLIDRRGNSKYRVAMGCCGVNPVCKFYKTEQQFVTERDRAIKICRQKNLCRRCQYVDSPCKLSSEGKRNDR